MSWCSDLALSLENAVCDTCPTYGDVLSGVLLFSPPGRADDPLIQVPRDCCLKVEHARHLGRMHWLGFNTGRIVARRGALD